TRARPFPVRPEPEGSAASTTPEASAQAAASWSRGMAGSAVGVTPSFAKYSAHSGEMLRGSRRYRSLIDSTRPSFTPSPSCAVLGDRSASDADRELRNSVLSIPSSRGRATGEFALLRGNRTSNRQRAVARLDAHEDVSIASARNQISYLRMQATTWVGSPDSVNGSSGGTASLHASIMYGQRGWKGQPRGGLTGLGISPWIGTWVRRRRGSGFGTESSKARVYGCVGRRKIVSFL